MSDELRGLDKLRFEDAERFGIDFVLGFTDRQRRPPGAGRTPIVWPAPDWHGEDRPQPAQD